MTAADTEPATADTPVDIPATAAAPETPTIAETPATASATTQQSPWPVRMLSRKMADYLARAPQVWVEGEIAQINIRPGNRMSFLTLRDVSANASIQATVLGAVLGRLSAKPEEGDRVVAHGHFEYYQPRGSLSFRIDEIHPVGIGELLARLEQLRALLASEGLTAPERKKPLPFLPGRVGLITGKDSAAESDVLTNARHRWPAVQFTVKNPLVQGASAVIQIIDALHELDADPAVDVIVLARGGGSMEDLLAFSDESLCRAVADCSTPVVSAVGHEPDHPIVDDVADLRCSTPTDAGKTIVPDAAAELRQVQVSRDRASRALTGWVDTETARLQRLLVAPPLADPYGPLDRRAADIAELTDRSLRTITTVLDRGRTLIEQRRAQLAALGPAATLARGYSIVQIGDQPGSRVMRHTREAPDGTGLRIRVADGAITATSHGTDH